MGILAWIIIGALAGWIASMIMGTNARQGAVGNIIVGILGAFVGGFIMQLISNKDWDSSFNLATLLVATAGACVVLFIYKALSRRA